MKKSPKNVKNKQAENDKPFFSKAENGESFFSKPGDNTLQLQPADAKAKDAAPAAAVADACKASSTPESKWANDNPGQVFGVEDTSAGKSESNELIFWNYCVGEAAMRAAHRERLNEVADRWVEILKKDGALKVKLQGAASTSGNVDSNKALAAERAGIIRDFLIAKKIPDSRIVIDNTSTPRSMAPETSPENQARNRRVELFLFRSTPVVNKLPPWVDVQVQNLFIGQQGVPTPKPTFNEKDNFFARNHFSMKASADITLTSLGGTGVGFSQVLTRDTLMAQYSDNAGRTLLLDYGNCNLLPCKDLENATSHFAIDGLSMFNSGPGTTQGKVAIRDRPGAAFPLHYPDSKTGPFHLTNYFWLMDFTVILGVREMGAFIPLNHAFWSVAGSEDVNIKQKSVSGMAPISVVSDWQPGMAPGMNLEAIYAGPTCRYVRRSEQFSARENVCKPNETIE
ncbi:outer membrane protein OmpA-like peptidoglycan-associated protein [Chitinophaga sp. W2I13]|uniref:OmpA family protein n=1 Tax=Chitinophaga sp. W2I13 TaxID=3373923 RepID=UPI003D24F995